MYDQTIQFDSWGCEVVVGGGLVRSFSNDLRPWRQRLGKCLNIGRDDTAEVTEIKLTEKEPLEFLYR